MAHADYDPDRDRIVVHTVWNEKDLLTAVPGARWDAVDRVWATPAAWATVVVLRGVLKDQLTLSERLVEWVWKLRHERIDPALALRSELVPTENDSREWKVLKSWRM